MALAGCQKTQYFCYYPVWDISQFFSWFLFDQWITFHVFGASVDAIILFLISNLILLNCILTSRDQIVGLRSFENLLGSVLLYVPSHGLSYWISHAHLKTMYLQLLLAGELTNFQIDRGGWKHCGSSTCFPTFLSTSATFLEGRVETCCGGVHFSS